MRKQLRMQKRVRLTDIAKALRVSVPTVSRALGGKGRMKESTRQRIRETAREMGYRPDPMLSRLAAYRAGESARTVRVLAILTDAVGENHPAGRTRIAAARARAEELGYHAETFPLAGVNGNAPRLADILKARGVDALVVDAVRRPGSYDGFPWNEFQAVAMGGGAELLPISTITNNLLSGLRIVWRKVVEAGYRRLGLVLLREDAVESHHLGFAGGKLAQSTHPDLAPLPVFPLPLRPDRGERAAFGEWLRTHRPDAVIGHDYVFDALRDQGLSVPGDLGFACYALWEQKDDGPDLAGVTIDLRQVGELAVELSHLELERPALSVRQKRILHLVEPDWQDGKSLPPKPRPRSRPHCNAEGCLHPSRQD